MAGVLMTAYALEMIKVVGLGQASVDWVRVQWPDGSRERFQGLEPGRYHRLRQGNGEKVDAS